MDSDADPFPTKKKKANIHPFKEFFISFIKKLYKFFNDNAVVASASSIIIATVLLYNQASDYMEKVDNINENFTSNSAEIVIGVDKTDGKTTIPIDCRKDEVVGILCNKDNITYDINSFGIDKVEITFSYKLDSPAPQEHKIDFTYTVVKKID